MGNSSRAYVSPASTGDQVSSVLDLFYRALAASPDAPAVSGTDRRSLTYGELDEAAERIAQALRRAGAGPGDVVALAMDRHPEQVAAMFAVWKAGAAYLALDLTIPAERIGFLLYDSGCRFLLAADEAVPLLPETTAKIIMLSEASQNKASLCPFLREELPAPGALAYVVYTSGSTGAPKGAKISHGGLANTISGIAGDLRLGSSDILLATSTVAFDIANVEIYVPLISGASVWLGERERAGSGPELMRMMEESAATVMLGTPTGYRLLLDAGWSGNPKLQLICGGEALPLELARRLAGRCRALWNHYGPTETSICATTDRVTADAVEITAGRPLPNVNLYVLDEALRPVGKGEMGEIYIGGAGMGLGYIGRPELTRSCFLSDPFSAKPGARIYKTGDLGCLRADGRLALHGRADDQVKVRGFRIELGEVETALLEHVDAAVVRAIEFAPGDVRLIAFVRSGGPVQIQQLRTLLRRRLPHYMLPSEYIALETFPMTPNGKVDRKALDAMRLRQGQAAMDAAPLGQETEAIIKAIWRRVFQLAAVASSDNFFELGGQSVLAARLCALIERELKVRVAPSVLVECPTVSALAAHIRQHPGGDSPRLVTIQEGAALPPLFLAHGLNGSLLAFRQLAAALGPEQPVIGLQLPTSIVDCTDEDMIPCLAAGYVAEMRRLLPKGPYQLAGHSFGGLLVFEIASQLRALDLEVKLLALLDTDFRVGRAAAPAAGTRPSLKARMEHLGNRVRLARSVGVGELFARRATHISIQTQTWVLRHFGRYASRHGYLFQPESYMALAVGQYQVRPYEGEVVLFQAEEEARLGSDPSMGWKANIRGRLELVRTPGTHGSMLTQPHVQALAQGLMERMLPDRRPRRRLEMGGRQTLRSGRPGAKNMPVAVGETNAVSF